MLKLSKTEKAQLRGMMQGKEWDALTNALDQTVTAMRAEVIGGQSAFESLRALHIRDGGVEALLAFFSALELEANS